jgi:uncharacterized RDD family membrane protein YckC
MVIRDPEIQQLDFISSEKLNPVLRFSARPLDRFCAQIFDCMVVLLPVFLCFSAPFKNRLYHGFLTEDQSEVLLCGAANVLIALLLFVTYQTIAIAHWGTTLGKRLFKIKIVDVWTGGRLNYARSFGRACCSGFSFLTLGLAFLPMLSNSRRRVLADLCFDTEVISEMTNDVAPPSVFERLTVRGIYGLVILIVVSLIAGATQMVLSATDETTVSSWVREQTAVCEAIDDAVSEWPKKDSEKPNRLQVALSLYAAGIVDKSCLRTEAEGEVASKMPLSPLYYLAQSFVHSDETEISDSYLKHVCEKDSNSSSCDLSRIVDAWSNNDWVEMEAAFTEMKAPDITASVWAIRHFMKHGEPEKAYSWIEKISPNKPLGSFLQVQRIQALWLMDRHAEAKLGALQALESLPVDSQFDLASWMCVQETSLECQNSSSVSCRWLSDRKMETSDNDPLFAVAMLHSRECYGDKKVDYVELANMDSSVSWRTLIGAVAKTNSGDKGNGRKILSQLIDDKNAPREYRAEAYRRYLGLVDNKVLVKLAETAADLPKPMWREVQGRFFEELLSRHLTEHALELAKATGSASAEVQAKLERLKGQGLRQPASSGGR